MMGVVSLIFDQGHLALGANQMSQFFESRFIGN